MKPIKKTKSHCSKCHVEHWGYDIEKDKCQKCGGPLTLGWLNEEFDSSSEHQKQAEAKAVWHCGKCSKGYLGFQKGNVCPSCGTRLQFKVTEAGSTSLVTCSKCRETFDYNKAAKVDGGVLCPKCKTKVDRRGRLIGKQSEGFHVTKIPGGGWRLRGKQLPAKRKEEELDTAVRSYVLGYFARLRG
jgi:DNA-directed RNA polymerase subunit RPC12/RpoP